MWPSNEQNFLEHKNQKSQKANKLSICFQVCMLIRHLVGVVAWEKIFSHPPQGSPFPIIQRTLVINNMKINIALLKWAKSIVSSSEKRQKRPVGLWGDGQWRGSPGEFQIKMMVRCTGAGAGAARPDPVWLTVMQRADAVTCFEQAPWFSWTLQVHVPMCFHRFDDFPFLKFILKLAGLCNQRSITDSGWLWEAEAGGSLRAEARLAYIMNSRPARAT